jgi:hypothetical protein
LSYQPAGGDKLDGWLKSEPDAGVRVRVLRWLMDLLENPDAADATSIPGQKLPVVTAFVPETNVAVTFFVARPFQIVVFVRIETVHLP